MKFSPIIARQSWQKLKRCHYGKMTS